MYDLSLRCPLQMNPVCTIIFSRASSCTVFFAGLRLHCCTCNCTVADAKRNASKLQHSDHFALPWLGVHHLEASLISQNDGCMPRMQKSYTDFRAACRAGKPLNLRLKKRFPRQRCRHRAQFQSIPVAKRTKHKSKHSNPLLVFGQKATCASLSASI